MTGLPVSLRQRLRPLVPLLAPSGDCVWRFVAVARPQFGVRVSSVEREGIAISMVVDTSTSMSALDLELDGDRQNRLAVAKACDRRASSKASKR